MKQLLKRTGLAGRLAGVVCIGVAAYVFAKFQGGFVSWFIFYMITPFVLYSLLLFLYPLRDFKVERKITDRKLTGGGQVTIHLQVSRSIPFPLLYTVITDRMEYRGTARSSRKIMLWGVRRHYEYTYTLMNIKRGEYWLPVAEVETVDFFNWIRKKRVFHTDDSFLVYPKIADLIYEPSSSRAGEGIDMSAIMMAKEASMPSGVREYATGDRMSWIHWKSYARTNKLMTKEFDDQQSEQYTVLLDGADSATFEQGIELAASLLVSARQRQTRMMLMTSSHQPAVFPSVNSSGQLEQSLLFLAKMQPEDPSARALPPRVKDLDGRLLIITGNLQLDFIQEVLRSYSKMSSIVCFVMTDEQEPVDEQVIEQVKKLGVNVWKIGKSNASLVLKEAVAS